MIMMGKSIRQIWVNYYASWTRSNIMAGSVACLYVIFGKKVKVTNNQEMAQSDRNFTPKMRWGKIN